MVAAAQTQEAAARIQEPEFSFASGKVEFISLILRVKIL
jgi:hypothetical protein